MAKYGYINVFCVGMENIVIDFNKKIHAWPSVERCSDFLKNSKQ